MALPYRVAQYNGKRIADLIGTYPLPQHVKDDLDQRMLLCMNCERARRSKGGSKLKRMAIAHAGGACIYCGYDASIAGLEFHHRDPTYKNFQITSRSIKMFEQITEEVAKCDLVCARCHGIHHTVEKLKERQSYIMSINKKDEIHPDEQVELIKKQDPHIEYPDQPGHTKSNNSHIEHAVASSVATCHATDSLTKQIKKELEDETEDAEQSIAAILANTIG